MHSVVPPSAAKLLDFIGSIEAPRGYDTIYGNNQHKLTKQITMMSLRELNENQAGFTKSFGSSASGRYQFMKKTLEGIVEELDLDWGLIFTPNLQDDLGWYLLRRRGYDKWVRGQMTTPDFMTRLAQEWASFPVPMTMAGAHRTVQRGETYYAGDRLNKSLVSPERVEGVLATAWALRLDKPTVLVSKEPVRDNAPPKSMPRGTLTEQVWAWVFNGFKKL